MSGVEVEILHRSDWTEVFRDLPRTKDVRWLDDLEGPGYGEFKVSGGDGNVADRLNEFAMNNLAAIKVNGQRVFTFKIDRWRLDEVNEGEDAGQWLTVSGQGIRAGLSHAIVMPSGYDHDHGMYRLAMDQRPFTFAALDYDETTDAWVAATEVALAGTAPFTDQPPAWPDAAASWITTTLVTHGDEFDDSPDANVMYFRQTFTLASNTTVVCFAAAAGVLEVYVDGEMVLETSKAWRIGEAELRLPPGTHQVAARYRPFADATEGVIVSIGQQTGTSDGEPTFTWLVRTSDAWSALGNTNPPPGFTPGRIMRMLVEEYEARCTHWGQPGFLLSLGLDFTDDLDSDGNPWTERVDRYWQVGTGVDQVLAELCESAAEAYVTPYGNLKMYAGERGSDLSAEVKLIVGYNIVNQSHEMFAGLGNHVIARWDAGWSEKHRQGTNPGGDLTLRREAFLSLGTCDSSTEARRIMTTALNNEGGQRRSMTCDMVSDVGARPYVDFHVGDYVDAFDIYTREMVAQRVVAIAGAQDENGEVVFTPELVLP